MIPEVMNLLPVQLQSGQPSQGAIAIYPTPAAENTAPGEAGPKAGDLFLRSRADGTTELVVSTGKAPAPLEAFRRAGGAAGRWLVSNRASAAVLAEEAGLESKARQAFLEGLLLGSYQFTSRKKVDQPAGTIKVWAGGDDRQLEQVRVTAAAVALVREWGHEPANVLNPAILAEKACTLAEQTGIKCTIYDHQALVAMGAGAITAVGQGSQTGARMIVLEYGGSATGQQQPLALVGKAITFDTGGYSLKSVENIRSMKYDKMGGITVLAVLTAAALLEYSQPLVGVICAAENMISAQAYRPDDIITSLSGKTIEIITTDAEGRLVLADGLTYVQRNFTPRAVIDVATLTGGVVTALGGIRAGVMTNNDELFQQLFSAGETVHERVWRLPLDDDYLEATTGDDADLKNSGGKEAHPIMGGIFLKQFIEGDLPWAHIDIAGTASSSKELPYSPKGATGFGVRLLLEYLDKLN